MLTMGSSSGRWLNHSTQPDDVRRRPKEAVALMDDDDVDKTLFDRAEQAGDARPIEVAAGKSAMLDDLGHFRPLPMPLRPDLGRANVALNDEAVELGVEAVSNALAGIDGAADWPAA